MDRPNCLTPEAQRIIAEAIRRGCYYTTACRLAGTSYQTFRRWRVRCEAGDEVAVRQFRPFFDALETELARAEMAAVREVVRGTPRWRAAAFFLERRFPRRWGRKYRRPDASSPLAVGRMSDEELERIARGPGASADVELS